MRVIAGIYRGRKLLSPKAQGVRPTPDRVKEAMFSMVQDALPDAICLDLFSGSGALGIEALSRGAERVYFCDNSAESVRLTRQNLDACKIDESQSVILQSDWQYAIGKLQEKCNVVFIDAPYDMWEHYSRMLEELGTRNVLEDGALVVLERDAGKGGYELPAGFESLCVKRYGGVGVDLVQYSGLQEEV